MGISWNSDKIPSVKVHESKNNKCWRERERERRRALITLGQFIWFYLTQTAHRSKIEIFLASKYSVILFWVWLAESLKFLSKKKQKTKKKTDELTHWKSCHQQSKVGNDFQMAEYSDQKFFFVF